MLAGEKTVILRRCDGLADELRVHVLILRRMAEGARFDTAYRVSSEGVLRASEQLRSSCERALGVRGRAYDRGRGAVPPGRRGLDG